MNNKENMFLNVKKPDPQKTEYRMLLYMSKMDKLQRGKQEEEGEKNDKR